LSEPCPPGDRRAENSVKNRFNSLITRRTPRGSGPNTPREGGIGPLLAPLGVSIGPFPGSPYASGPKGANQKVVDASSSTMPPPASMRPPGSKSKGGKNKRADGHKGGNNTGAEGEVSVHPCSQGPENTTEESPATTTYQPRDLCHAKAIADVTVPCLIPAQMGSFGFPMTLPSSGRSHKKSRAPLSLPFPPSPYASLASTFPGFPSPGHGLGLQAQTPGSLDPTTQSPGSFPFSALQLPPPVPSSMQLTKGDTASLLMLPRSGVGMGADLFGSSSPFHPPSKNAFTPSLSLSHDVGGLGIGSSSYRTPNHLLGLPSYIKLEPPRPIADAAGGISGSTKEWSGSLSTSHTLTLEDLEFPHDLFKRSLHSMSLNSEDWDLLDSVPMPANMNDGDATGLDPASILRASPMVGMGMHGMNMGMALHGMGLGLGEGMDASIATLLQASSSTETTVTAEDVPGQRTRTASAQAAAANGPLPGLRPRVFTFEGMDLGQPEKIVGSKRCDIAALSDTEDCIAYLYAS
jgi:hypothetical protein